MADAPSIGDVFLESIVAGDLALIETMLKKRKSNGLAMTKYQDSSGSTAYTVAIREGYVVIVQMLLKYDVPLGDALLRAVDANFMDAVNEICTYAKKNPNLKETLLNHRCGNGDLHPRFTPIILAAYNNNFDIVEVLLDMGAFIPEPDESKSPNTIQECHDAIDIYKALCSEAYISLASSDPIERAFDLCKRLHRLSILQSDFSAEFISLKERVQQYAGDLLGQCRSTEEIMAVMTYEQRKEHREPPEGTRFLLVKLLRAIEFGQKEFVAHPNCQQILITHYYRGLSNYRDWSMVKQLMFTALLLLGYPFVSIVYLLIPSKKITRFVRIPFVKFLIHTGADMLFLGVMIIIAVASELSQAMISMLTNYAALCVIGLGWKHCKEIMSEGLTKYLSNGRNLIDTLILVLYASAYMTKVSGSHRANTVVPKYHLELQQRSLNFNVLPSSEAFHQHVQIHTKEFEHGQDVSTDTDFDVELSLGVQTGHNRSKRASKKRQGERDDEVTALHLDVPSSESVHKNAPIHTEEFEQNKDLLPDTKVDVQLPLSVQTGHNRSKRADKKIGGVTLQTADADVSSGRQNIYLLDPFDPRVVARVLFGVVAMCLTIRLLTLTTVSEALGPFKVSLGAMITDLIKFCIFYIIILLAFAVGMTQIYRPYMKAAYINCVRQGEAGCTEGAYSSFTASLETLLWVLIGLANNTDLRIDTEHSIMKFTGILLFALYLVVGIIVMLNTLIAMMASTYFTVEANADLEWKFSRAQLWTSYLMLGATVPPPFNLIPSIKSLRRFFYNICCPLWAEKEYAKSCEEKARMAREVADETHYKRVLKTLVGRYVQQEGSDENNAEAALSLQDVRALRNDIIAFRYESSLKFQVTDSLLQDTMSDVNKVSEDTVQVNDIAERVNRMDQHSNVQITDVSMIHNLVAQLPELTKMEPKQRRQIPAKPEEKRKPNRNLGALITKLVTDYEHKRVVAESPTKTPAALLQSINKMTPVKESEEAEARPSGNQPGTSGLKDGGKRGLLQKRFKEVIKRRAATEQPGISEEQPGTSGEQPGTSGEQPATSEEQPGTSGEQPGTSEEQPGTSGEQPGTSEKQPGTSGEQPGTSGEQPGTSGEQPGLSEDQPGISGLKDGRTLAQED